MPLADPFDLPEWLGAVDVVWQATETVADADTVTGVLVDAERTERPLRLDLVAVDAAWPEPVCPETDRRAAHQAWHYGEVALLEGSPALVLGVPGSALGADLVSEAVRRFARAVGAKTQNYSVQLRL
jgi:hypothetical protein